MGDPSQGQMSAGALLPIPASWYGRAQSGRISFAWTDTTVNGQFYRRARRSRSSSLFSDGSSTEALRTVQRVGTKLDA